MEEILEKIQQELRDATRYAVFTPSSAAVVLISDLQWLCNELERSRGVTVLKLREELDKVNLSIQGEAGLQFAALLTKFFDDNGGSNFFSFDLKGADTFFSVTIQKPDSEVTPATKMQQQTEQIDRMHQALRLAMETMEQAGQLIVTPAYELAKSIVNPSNPQELPVTQLVDTFAGQSIHDFYQVPSFAVFEKPLDIPDKFVVRLFDGVRPTAFATVRDSLEEARLTIPRGLARFFLRDPQDRDNLVETWL